jgi:protoporphyrinogen oxidase
MNIAIIGAGATGLAAAHDLLNIGHRVTIFEANDKPGGLAAGFKEPHWDWSLEKFYHHWFASDADLLKLASEIGVSDRVKFFRPITVSYYEGDFLQLDSPLSALMFRGLPISAKIPFGLAGAYLKLTSNWRALEKVTAHEWLTRYMGKAAYELLFEPLLVGKFGEYAQQVNMAWFWARIKSRTSKLGTFVGGFQAFFDALADSILQRGGEIRFSTRVENLRIMDDERWTVNSQEAYDRVLVTTSPKLLTQFVPNLPNDYLAGLRELKSLGAVVAVFSLKRQLSERGHYWHNLPKRAGFPFLALCEHTNFVSAENFGGDHLVYCGDYLPTDHPHFSKTDDELCAIFAPSLKRVNPNFDQTWINKTWVFKEAYAQPVPLVNHSRNIPSTQTPFQGLFFASMSHVYPWDRGTNYAIRLGRQVAQEMM